MPLVNGLYASDFHTFAPYSDADRAWAQLEKAIVEVPIHICVTGGDMHEFIDYLPPIPPVYDITDRVINDREARLQRHPNCTFFDIEGNHERFESYRNILGGGNLGKPENLVLSPSFVIIGDGLFLHGDKHYHPETYDTANPYQQPMLEHVRKPWRKSVEIAGAFAAPHIARHTILRPQKIVRKVHETLEKTSPELLKKIRHVFMGHLHVDFTNVEYKGILFHNAGAAIKGSPETLNMLLFTYDPDEERILKVEPLRERGAERSR